MKQTVLRFDSGLTKWVAATFGQRSRPFFLLMTMLGDPLAVGVITVGLVGAGLYTSNIDLAIGGAAIPATVVVGAILKVLFERARPLTEYALNMKLKTFSFPSGHSNGSMIAYGLLAYLTFNGFEATLGILIGSLFAFIPMAVGVSRVYLGAHFPSDVIAGWLLGALSLLLVIIFAEPRI